MCVFIAAILQYGFVDSSSTLSEPVVITGRVRSIAYALWVAIRPVAAGGRFRVVIEALSLIANATRSLSGRHRDRMSPLDPNLSSATDCNREVKKFTFLSGTLRTAREK